MLENVLESASEAVQPIGLAKNERVDRYGENDGVVLSSSSQFFVVVDQHLFVFGCSISAVDHGRLIIELYLAATNRKNSQDLVAFDSLANDRDLVWELHGRWIFKNYLLGDTAYRLTGADASLRRISEWRFTPKPKWDKPFV